MSLLIGIIGMFLLLLAFLLNQINIWKPDYLIYDLTNAIGGILMVIYAYLINSWPFLILNAVWALFSIKDVFVDLKRIK